MATGGLSENITIRELAETPPPTEYDGDESFVVLGRSPTSFTFNENASFMLQDALKSLGDEQATSAVNDNEEKKEEKATDDAKDDKGVSAFKFAYLQIIL